jgi:hypothetical protein
MIVIEKKAARKKELKYSPSTKAIQIENELILLLE